MGVGAMGQRVQPGRQDAERPVGVGAMGTIASLPCPPGRAARGRGGDGQKCVTVTHLFESGPWAFLLGGQHDPPHQSRLCARAALSCERCSPKQRR